MWRRFWRKLLRYIKSVFTLTEEEKRENQLW